MSEPRCPFRPELTLVAPPRKRGATLGWSTSAAVVALGLSGLAALAMQAAPGGEAGETEMAIPILLPPAPALGALSEAAPEAAPEMPETAEAPVQDMTPDLPESADAPARPETPQTPGADHAEAAPEVERAAPPPPEPAALAEAEVEPAPLVRPRAKPQKQMEKPTAKKEAAAKTKPAQKAKPAEAAKDRSVASAEAAPVLKQAAKGVGGGKVAAASYGAEVMKKIRKTKKHKAGARGTAVVGFQVSGSGGLALARIIRSSGSPTLDQVALDHIRRAAPFAPPPPGAETRFSFEFVGK